MSPTAEIARDLAADAILRKFQRDSYAKYHRNVAEARERAAKYKEQRTCTR